MANFPASITFLPRCPALLRDMAGLVASVAKFIRALGVMMIPKAKHAGYFGLQMAVFSNVAFLATSEAFLRNFLRVNIFLFFILYLCAC